MSEQFVVHKFGGTSVANAERYENVARIMRASTSRNAIVVSAMSKVTDLLHDLVDGAEKRDPQNRERLATVLKMHRDCVGTLFHGSDDERALIERLEKDARDLEDLVRATFVIQRASETLLEYVAGHGELWSAAILTALLRKHGDDACMIDARDVIVVEHTDTGPRIHWDESEKNMARALDGAKGTIVVTGYIARTPDGTPTTLKRNGSDFSASIVGALLDAREIVIWTDVDGVLSADPRRVPEAVVTSEMSYAEAAELAYFGAKVLHPHTMAPAIAKKIPIWIKNSFAPEKPGTCIKDSSLLPRSSSDTPVRGFASIDGVALLNVEGTGMIGVPGVAERLFRALRDVDVNVILISQGSSEHSICVAVFQRDAIRARDAVRRAFSVELTDKLIHAVDVSNNVGILAAVGEGMAETPGVSGRLFSALARSGVNVRAVAQGSSERNISIVVDEVDLPRALRAAHAGFYLSDQTLSVGIVGPGGIGRVLIDQIESQREWLKRELHVDVRVRAIASSKKMVLAEQSVDLTTWSDDLKKGADVDLDAFTTHLSAPHLPHRVVIDCTASDDVAERTVSWLQKGIHVITPNKKAESGPHDRWTRLLDAKKKSGAHFFREATVGAGLPILSTLADLQRTGDDVKKIEGILSGTLSYLFNTYDGSTPWSALVREAKRQGFTEPDPRDDLSGTDVARKVVILAREIGVDLSLSDVKVESLVPEELRAAKTADEFLDGLAAHDDVMRALAARAQSENQVLRYIGVVEKNGDARVSLERLASNHPFARISGTDNIIAFTTSRYEKQPLIVQGPGAGPDVTAGGVFSDVLRLAAHLGARS